MSTESQRECLLFDISGHSITKIIASMYLLSLCQLSIKNEYICVTLDKSNVYKINTGLNQNYKHLLISKCLSLYFHLNFKKITCSPDQTTNYQFSLNEWIHELSNNQNEFCLFICCCFFLKTILYVNYFANICETLLRPIL